MPLIDESRVAGISTFSRLHPQFQRLRTGQVLSVLGELLGRYVLDAIMAPAARVDPGGAFEMRFRFSRLTALG
jgi:hypothetical protein